MFVIEYFQHGRIGVIVTDEEMVALALEELLISLDSVLLVAVWGPI